MNDIQTINEIINSAVKDSSYTTVIISCSVFIAYVLINKIVELYKAKDKNKPLLEMAGAIKQISENVVKLNQVLDKTFQDVEVKEVSRINNVIQVSFNAFKSAVITRCLDIIVHNHIDLDKETITQNLYKTVSTEYYRLYSILSSYEHDSVNVASKVKEEWIDEITDECLRIIYNGQDSIDRIRQLNNKLLISFEEYSIYVNNKVFNH